jgi:hypothetical protein
MSGTSDGARLAASKLREQMAEMKADIDCDPPSMIDYLPYALVNPATVRAALRIESAAALRLAQSLGVSTP